MAAAGRDPSPKPFPWAAVMDLGLARLRLSPTQFWAMTPAELLAAAGKGGGALQPPDRGTLEALMARWPDSSPFHAQMEADDDRRQ
jgi:uncharacterized phage protein (TIGR02216 family)